MEYLKDNENRFPLCPACTESIYSKNKIPQWSYVSEQNNYGFP